MRRRWVQSSRDIPASDFFMEEIGGGRFFVRCCVSVLAWTECGRNSGIEQQIKQITMNRQPQYAPLGIERHRVELEGVLANSVVGTIKNSSIEVNDYEDKPDYDSDNEFLILSF
jgi:hypothetical protein